MVLNPREVLKTLYTGFPTSPSYHCSFLNSLESVTEELPDQNKWRVTLAHYLFLGTLFKHELDE